MTTQRFYHVADASYRAGDDLLCWDRLVEAGRAPAWKWDEVDVGYDGDLVCLYGSLEDARAHRAEFDPTGHLLAVDLDVEDGVALYPQYERRLLTNAEGYTCLPEWIPGRYVTILD